MPYNVCSRANFCTLHAYKQRTFCHLDDGSSSSQTLPALEDKINLCKGIWQHSL